MASDVQAAMAAVKKKEKENMETLGWYAHIVGDDQADNTPTRFNYHTHGCGKSWTHPDFQIVARIPPEVAHEVAGCAIEQIKKGRRFKPGETSNEIITDFDVMFAAAKESGRDVLRIILPGPNGKVEEGKMDEPWAAQWEGASQSFPIIDPSLN
jgi:YD repeat-containing protein